MIQLFVVFHKTLYDECYKNIPQSILDKYFTFIAVNPSIPKNYTQNKYKILNEWEFPIYDNTLQDQGYNENSAIYHIYKNGVYKAYTHIGFFQYDMKFENMIRYILTSISDGPVYFPVSLHTFAYCSEETWNESETLNVILKDYESFFNTKYRKDELIPLYNAYIIPIEAFEKIMPWVIQLFPKLYPWCVQLPNKTHKGHIGGIYERVMGYAISQLKMIPKLIKVNHDSVYKLMLMPS